MESKGVERLVQEEKISLNLAEKLWEASGGDYDQACEWAQRRHHVVKGRFSGVDGEIYGMLYIEFDLFEPELVRVDVTVGSDPSLGNVSVHTNRNRFLSTLREFDGAASKMIPPTRDIKESLKRRLNPPEGEWRELLQEFEETRFQDRLEELINGVLRKYQVFLNVELKDVLEEDLETELKARQQDQDGKLSPPDDNDETTVLACHPKVSPIRGQIASEIRRFDDVYVMVHAEENRYPRLTDVIQRFEDTIVGAVSVPVINRGETDTGKLEFLVEFGENVYGRFVIGRDMYLLTPADQSNHLEFAWWWFGVPVLLVIALVVALYLLLML